MVVELKIKKKNPWAGLIKYRSCYDYIAPYFTRSGSIYTGLTPEDEEYFEKALGYPEGHLSKTSDFWTTFCVKIGARTLLLDDSIPRQAMIIKFLTGHKRVATSLDKMDAGKDYLLINREAEAIEQNKQNKLRREAVKEFDKLSSPKKFFDKWVDNKNKETEYLIEEAIAKGVIRKDRTQYYYGSEMFADSLPEAVAYLDAKKNQDLKLSIINETKNK